MVLAEQLIKDTPNHSLTMFDRGFYSLGLLHQLNSEGQERHWMEPARKGLQFEVLESYSRVDKRVILTTTPQARKKFPTLPNKLEARLITKKLKGKECRILTSLIDVMRYSSDEIADLYSHRWDFELGYREVKQTLLNSEYTLRSKRPDMVEQELWGLLLAYNLIRVAMTKAELNAYPSTNI